MFTKSELRQFKLKRISPNEIQRQITILRQGEAYQDLLRPAILNDGILAISRKKKKYLHEFKKIAKDKKIVKFVPASGAATRMFQALIEYQKNPENIKYNKECKVFLDEFISCLSSFAFYPELKNIESLPEIIEYLFAKNKLNYLQRPKGLIPFHKYAKESRTAFEEHILEGIPYTVHCDNIARIHFTVSPEHRKLFNALLRKIARKIEKKYSCELRISFSIQDPSTDTIALDTKGQLYKNKEEQVLFRPAGHGALLKNLNKINSDLIVIKNIDNIAHDWLKPLSIDWEKILIGYCAEIQKQIFAYIRILKNNSADLQEIKEFLVDVLNLKCLNGKKLNKGRALQLLDRPLRVCGMVRNEGEPGGGPFWIKTKEFSCLQIVEKDQISLKQRVNVLKKAKYFNPVNLVCAVKNYRGDKFDLTKYSDENAVIITKKHYNGDELKALERPGLWNGAMANWNTVFIEMPLETFTPVKTVNDLLRPEHQG